MAHVILELYIPNRTEQPPPQLRESLQDAMQHTMWATVYAKFFEGDDIEDYTTSFS